MSSNIKANNYYNKIYPEKSDQGWYYHTHINPLTKTEDPLTKAFESFLKDMLLPEDFIRNELHLKKQSKKLNIDTKGSNDKIDGTSFLKSLFLINRKFKQRLVDYYNPLDIFVKGPNELIKRDGTSTGQWVIELSIINKYKKSDDDDDEYVDN